MKDRVGINDGIQEQILKRLSDLESKCARIEEQMNIPMFTENLSPEKKETPKECKYECDHEWGSTIKKCKKCDALTGAYCDTCHACECMCKPSPAPEKTLEKEMADAAWNNKIENNHYKLMAQVARDYYENRFEKGIKSFYASDAHPRNWAWYIRDALFGEKE